MEALRHIGIVSATEGKWDTWAIIDDEIGSSVEVHPWGIPDKRQDKWARFRVALKNYADDHIARSISFELGARELGNYEQKVYLSTRNSFVKSSQNQWDHLEIREFGNISHLIINFDEEGKINNVNGYLNELPPGVTEKSFHADLIQDDLEPEKPHGNMDQVLNIVNQALGLENKPINLDNLNPGLIITECLKPEVALNNNILNAAITS